MDGYGGYGGIQRDTAGYSGEHRDTAGYGGYSGIPLDDAGYSGMQRDTARYSGIQRDTIKIYSRARVNTDTDRHLKLTLHALVPLYLSTSPTAKS